MVTSAKVGSQIDIVLQAAGRALSATDSGSYNALISHLNTLDSQAREALQARLDEHLWPIVAKLENDQPLAAAEQEILQLLLVGDAKAYLKTEDQVENWRSEAGRLIEEIRRVQAEGLEGLDRLMGLQALCREAMRVLPDLAYYYQEQERARRFEAAMRGQLDRETRRTLANLIKEMLTSDKV